MEAVSELLATLWDVVTDAVAYAFAHARVQFHPALIVLLYWICLAVILVPVVILLSVVTPLVAVRWDFVGYVVGVLATGELARGHAKVWLDAKPGKWSPTSSLIGGLSAGIVAVSVPALKNGSHGLTDALFGLAFAAAMYLVLGFLFHIGAQRELDDSA